MGPHSNELQRELAAYKRQHPSVIIHAPEETHSRLWEVSLPSTATMAFDSLGGMLRALRMTTIPAE